MSKKQVVSGRLVVLDEAQVMLRQTTYYFLPALLLLLLRRDSMNPRLQSHWPGGNRLSTANTRWWFFADETNRGYLRSVWLDKEKLTTETSEVPEHLAYYIDYDRMGRDLEMSGDIFTVETGCQEVLTYSGHIEKTGRY